MPAQIIACLQCGRMLVIPETWQGKVMRCPRCGTRFITGPDAEPQAVPFAEPLADDAGVPLAEAVPELPPPPGPFAVSHWARRFAVSPRMTANRPAPNLPSLKQQTALPPPPPPQAGPVIAHPIPQPLVSPEDQFLPALQPLEAEAVREEERPRRHHVEIRPGPVSRSARPEPVREVPMRGFLEQEDLTASQPEPRSEASPAPRLRRRRLPPLEGPSQTGKVVLLLLGIFGALLVFGGLAALIVQLSQRGHPAP